MGSGSGQMLCTITRKENLIVKKSILLVMALAMVFGAVSFAQAGWVSSVVDSPIPPFSTYLYEGGDFGWTHDSLCCGLTKYVDQANLSLYAWDVDSPSGEVDVISAYDRTTSSWVVLGSLVGDNGVWSTTTFAIPASLLDDVRLGLQVYMDIDSTSDGWAVTLQSSTLDANCVPIPGGLLLLGSGLAGLLGLRQRFLA